MGKKRLYDVDGVYKSSTEITFDDLIILYKQFVKKYAVYPSNKYCVFEYNMIGYEKAKQILESRNMTFNDLYNIVSVPKTKYIKNKYSQIQIGDVYGRWKVIDKADSRIASNGSKIPYWLCKCTCGSEIVKEISENALKTGNSTSCGCVRLERLKNAKKGNIFKKTFYEWCIDNNHQDFLDRWDYSLNKIAPNEISYCSHEAFYFICPCGKHKSSKHTLNVVSSSSAKDKLPCRYCNSFAQKLINAKGEDALEKYWDYDMNTDDPWLISKSSKVYKVWLKCINTDYHGSYETTRDNALTGCPYCSHSKIHPRDSFGQWFIDNYGQDAIEKYIDKEKTQIDLFSISPSTALNHIWIKCQNKDYHPSSCYTANDIKNMNGNLCCRYCSSTIVCEEDSLAYKYPQVVSLWSDKNEKSPFEYAVRSNQDVWWKCNNQLHNDYKRKICDSVNYEFRCPDCSYEKKVSFLQEKVDNYVTNKYGFIMLHETNCSIVPKNPKTKCNLPFDNEIKELKLLIEVHGKQHYEITGFTYLTAKQRNTTVEYELKYQQWRDNYKKEYAFNHGYSYLEIPYWTEEKDEYQKLIDIKINELLGSETKCQSVAKE